MAYTVKKNHNHVHASVLNEKICCSRDGFFSSHLGQNKRYESKHEYDHQRWGRCGHVCLLSFGFLVIKLCSRNPVSIDYIINKSYNKLIEYYWIFRFYIPIRRSIMYLPTFIIAFIIINLFMSFFYFYLFARDNKGNFIRFWGLG